MSAEWEPRKSPWTVAARRLKRRLKAAASLGLALAAGTFLTLQSDARGDNSVPPGGKDKGSAKGKGKDGKDAKNEDEKKKDKDKDKDKNKGQVDKDEHRKGMPVRDNLLE
jgi:hypothetical protein